MSNNRANQKVGKTFSVFLDGAGCQRLHETHAAAETCQRSDAFFDTDNTTCERNQKRLFSAYGDLFAEI